MCGRFTLRTPLNVLIKHFGITAGMELQLPIRYNVAPTNSVAVVRQSNGARELTTMKWGLIPSWSAEPKMSYSTINAKSEEAAQKPAFRSAMKHRHCLVLADGYYEWATVGKKKFPHLFQLRDQPVFGLAGLWERWDKGEGEPIESCTILTTSANELVKPFHDRMPVILSPIPRPVRSRPGFFVYFACTLTPKVAASLSAALLATRSASRGPPPPRLPPPGPRPQGGVRADGHRDQPR
jgi:putative SOS response-associated peptidase YedK